MAFLRRGLVLTALLAVATMLVGPGVALAGPQTALVRVAHFSPDAPAVDVYLDGGRIASDVGYSTVSSYREVPAGSHTITVRPHGASPSSAAAAKTTEKVAAGKAYTVAGIGRFSKLSLHTFTDDFTLPPAGKSRVRVIHASPTTPAVDARVTGGPVLFQDVSFGDATDYAAIAPGDYGITMDKAGTKKVLWSVKGVAVKAGAVYTLAAVGGLGEPKKILSLSDAAGAKVAPQGGASTGEGGTAPGGVSDGLAVGFLGGATLLSLLAVTVRRRPRLSRRPAAR
jgi:hypothetical protein